MFGFAFGVGFTLVAIVVGFAILIKIFGVVDDFRFRKIQKEQRWFCCAHCRELLLFGAMECPKCKTSYSYGGGVRIYVGRYTCVHCHPKKHYYPQPCPQTGQLEERKGAWFHHLDSYVDMYPLE